MKNFAKITAIILCAALLASCSQNDKNKRTRETTERTRSTTEETESETTTEATTTTTTEATTTTTTAETTESEEPVVYTADIDSQLQLIADSFDVLSSDLEENLFPMTPMFTVADLNHNGRLEIIISDIQGSGKISYTRYYEVSEDYSSLVLLTVNGEAQTDEYGDISMPRHSDQIVTYNCYSLNGEYYYEIMDYASASGDDKYLHHFSYHFGEGVDIEPIGGCALSVDRDLDGVINVWLYDAQGELFTGDDDYLDYLNSYWSGYESQGTCETLWAYFEEDGFEDDVIACYNGFDPDSDREAEETHDYRVYFEGIFTDDAEYVIQTE